MEFDIIIEALNAIFAVMAVIFAVSVMNLVRGGKIAGVWQYVSVAALFLGAHEILGILREVPAIGEAVNLDSAREIAELLYIATLAFALMKAKKAFTL